MVWLDLGRPGFGIDDANIFFVYARNIVHGHGFVYNVGGEHVDGASSLLYLLLCCLVWPFSSHPETALFAINFLCVAIICILVFGLFQRLESALGLPRRSALALYAAFLVWLLLNPSFFMWSVVTLMDEGLYSLIVLMGFVMLARWMLDDSPVGLRQAQQLSLVILLTILVRPEGVAWGLLEALCFVVVAHRAGRDRSSPRWVPVLPSLALVVGYLALLGAHTLYFGYPFPNTYYAKVSADRSANLNIGIHYFHVFVLFYSWFVLLPFFVTTLGLCIALARKRRLSPMLGFALITVAFIALGLSLPILEGGEAFGFRMFQPVYLFLSICVIVPLLPLLRRGRWALVSAGACVFILLYAVTTHSTWSQFRSGNRDYTPTSPTSARMGFSLVGIERTNGRSLSTIFSPSLPTVGDAAAGALAYGYNGPFYDLLGLNNTQMAHADRVKVGPKDHASFDQAVFFSLAPDVFLPHTQPAGTSVDLHALQAHYLNPKSFESQIYKGIFTDAAFQAEYQLAVVQPPMHPELICYGFFRKDYLAQLTTIKGFRLLQQV